jgi:RNA polymerase-binding transcription factor DksA
MLGVLGGDIRHLQNDAESDSGSAAASSTEDRGSEVSNLELALELLSHDQHTQDEVFAALERIDAGTFGRCEACQAWIRKSRLNMVPHARNCIDCQRAAENGQAR